MRKQPQTNSALVSLLSVGAGLAAFGAASWAQAEDGAEPRGSEAAARRVVRQALPYLAQQTGAWIEEKKCTSCHQVPHALWAMNAARAAGNETDGRLAEWNRWAVDFVLRGTGDADGNAERARVRGDEIYQMLLAGGRSDYSEGRADERLLKLLLLGQQPDGLWHGQGQLPDQNRSKSRDA